MYRSCICSNSSVLLRAKADKRDQLRSASFDIRYIVATVALRKSEYRIDIICTIYDARNFYLFLAYFLIFFCEFNFFYE